MSDADNRRETLHTITDSIFRALLLCLTLIQILLESMFNTFILDSMVEAFDSTFGSSATLAVACGVHRENVNDDNDDNNNGRSNVYLALLVCAAVTVLLVVFAACALP